MVFHRRHQDQKNGVRFSPRRFSSRSTRAATKNACTTRAPFCWARATSLISAGDGTIPDRAPAVTPEQDAIAKAKAEAIAAQATPANFDALTAKTEEPGGKEKKGDLGVFRRDGAMIEAFTQGVLGVKPGEVTKVVKSAFGYHIIYRMTYAEAKAKNSPEWQLLSAHPMQAAESTYLAGIDSVAKIKVDKNAPINVRAVARNTLGYANDQNTVAEWNGGKMTLSRLADVMNAYPPQANMKAQILSQQVTDSMLVGLVKMLVRNQILLKQADSAKMTLDTAEMNNMHLGFRNNLTTAWTQLGVDPKSLADSAKSEADRVKLAGVRVDQYFDKLVKNEVGFADIGVPGGTHAAEEVQVHHQRCRSRESRGQGQGGSRFGRFTEGQAGSADARRHCSSRSAGRASQSPGASEEAINRHRNRSLRGAAKGRSLVAFRVY